MKYERANYKPADQDPRAVHTYYTLCMTWRLAGINDEVDVSSTQRRALIIDRTTGRETYRRVMS